MKRISIYLSLVLMSWIFIAACATGVIQTNSNNPSSGSPNPDAMTTAKSFANAKVNLSAFNIGSDFPPDIKIPDINGMQSTAFVVTFFPAAVVPLNLDANPVVTSSNFPVFDASAISAAASPNHVLLLSPTQAILLGSSGLVYFNPTTGAVLDTLDLTTPISLTQALPYSRPGDCNGDMVNESSVGPGSFNPSFAADLAVIDNRLFVTMSNACFDSSFESFYPQSIVLVFDVHNNAPFFTPAFSPYVALSGFNATGITTFGNKLIITSTGDTKFFNGGSIPETTSFLDELDPETLQITRTLNLGLVAANFEALAITSDGSKGFIGSSSFSEVYEIDLDNFSLLRGKNNPLTIFGSGDDFITDQKIAFGDQILFVSSFNNSGVKAIDLTGADLEVLPDVLNFAFQNNPGVTGAGPMALRPGQPTIDFSGPDLWVLTSSPGTVSSATTY